MNSKILSVSTVLVLIVFPSFAFAAGNSSSSALSIELSKTNPSGDIVPAGSRGVQMLSVHVQAPCDRVTTIDQITFVHEGMKDTNEITSVYLSAGKTALSKKAVIDPQSQTVTLNIVPALVIDKCKDVTIDVLADISPKALEASKHSLMLELSYDTISDAPSVDGTFPIRGNVFEITGPSPSCNYANKRFLTQRQRSLMRRDCRKMQK
jgi:hypothetical protein